MLIKEIDSYKYGCPMQKQSCVGKCCMAWKWEVEEKPTKVSTGLNSFRVEVRTIISATHGYCGMVK